MMLMSKRLLSSSMIIAFLVIVTMFAAASINTVNKNLNSSGAIQTSIGINVYSDDTCTSELTNVEWGTISPGSVLTRTIYVKNTGQGVSLELSMSTSNWSPTSANSYITVEWDKEGYVLAPTEYVKATLTIEVSQDITGIEAFSNTISITGTATSFQAS
jgi:hypothetical protein